MPAEFLLGNNMAQTLITKHTISIIRDVIDRAKDLQHGEGQELNLFKGELKELFVAGILKRFLPRHLGIGSGTVINAAGSRSLQTDIIIYDNRILPPFIQEQHLGVYPAESVIGTLEIKTTLTAQELGKTVRATNRLSDIFNEEMRILPQKHVRPPGPMDQPFYAMFAFGVRGLKPLCSNEQGPGWLNQHVGRLFALCVPHKFCWTKLIGQAQPWRMQVGQNDVTSGEYNYAETACFIGIFVDSVRIEAENRYAIMARINWPCSWLSLYIRE